MASIQGIYVALFGRPADPLGLQYFNEATNNGADLSQIGDLAATDEYQQRFDGLNNVQIVTRIYQELFGRDPDAAGLAFFVASLNSGTQTINTIAINILDGARGDDLAVVNNKIAAANLFTSEIDTSIEIGSYVGDDAAAAGRAFLADVTADVATVPTQADAADAVEAIVEAGVAGNDITVAAGVDVVVGGGANDSTNDNDTITVTGTYDPTAEINGGLGRDTAYINVAGAAVATTEDSLVSIERLHVTAGLLGGDIDLSETTGLQEVYANVSDNDLTISGLDVDGTVGVESDAANGGVAGGLGDVTLEFADVGEDGDSVTISIDSGVNLAGDLIVAGVENITLDVDGPATLGGLVFADGETLAITGTGDLVVGSVDFAAEDVTIDASDHVGRFTITTGAVTDALTIEGGASNDVFNVTGNAEGVTLTGGAGSDFFNIGTLSNLDVVDDADAVSADLISITDFNGAQGGDTLQIATGGSLEVLTSVESDNIEGADTLIDALDFAAAATTIGNYATFQYEGDTYVFQNNGGQGFDSGDGLVQLVGFTGEFNAQNFVA